MATGPAVSLVLTVGTQHKSQVNRPLVTQSELAIIDGLSQTEKTPFGKIPKSLL